MFFCVLVLIRFHTFYLLIIAPTVAFINLNITLFVLCCIRNHDVILRWYENIISLHTYFHYSWFL